MMKIGQLEAGKGGLPIAQFLQLFSIFLLTKSQLCAIFSNG